MVVAEATATETVIMAVVMAGGGGEKTTINKRWECRRRAVDTSITAGDDKQ